ncbi:LPXTG cell wall anchor domain-containing protein [Enterococcus rivorum]|uniref:Gram-positive cocci surface proteins LPxTG domain-containing protein n=1 Tax=Enterococcus rivorum TaxID=762845 RepID=A0A1E5KWQ7_9ENTE|nr:LPXTG cell wall anchor domain-containing protein [Enterococcus rivorum]MBP2097351.1 LPXTG-motif cell wall-anchored protein [Enterococcus rivorum]OEH82304.1 hypothetical protein BCR26_02405 [Enterococcus rivorum]
MCFRGEAVETTGKVIFYDNETKTSTSQSTETSTLQSIKKPEGKLKELPSTGEKISRGFFVGGIVLLFLGLFISIVRKVEMFEGDDK